MGPVGTATARHWRAARTCAAEPQQQQDDAWRTVVAAAQPCQIDRPASAHSGLPFHGQPSKAARSFEFVTDLNDVLAGSLATRSKPNSTTEPTAIAATIPSTAFFSCEEKPGESI